ncbi:MAG TPA: triose-phosphate isomerase [Candidatus Dormibacteraeota bacterium]|nr:triose-phosphate isomerase [Candidatus Dormibacteraeota bacterium]
MPRIIVAGNWKMHKTAAETRAFFDAFLPRATAVPEGVTIVVAPPFTALASASESLVAQSRVSLGAQTMHWETSGAFTGEISAPMLLEFGVTHVILGHSERRMYCNELDAAVNLKVKAALAHGLTPIVAVGESLAERQADATDERVTTQTRAALEGLSSADIARVALAYEPIWAIGTGHNCDPAEANRVMGVMRACVDGLAAVPILYGGSMNSGNAATYLAQANINGGLVGGASLDANGFVELIGRVIGSLNA